MPMKSLPPFIGVFPVAPAVDRTDDRAATTIRAYSGRKPGSSLPWLPAVRVARSEIGRLALSRGTRGGRVTLLRRRPREVYRVYSEEEYLNGAGAEPASVGEWPVAVEPASMRSGERRLRRVAGGDDAGGGRWHGGRVVVLNGHGHTVAPGEDRRGRLRRRVRRARARRCRCARFPCGARSAGGRACFPSRARSRVPHGRSELRRPRSPGPPPTRPTTRYRVRPVTGASRSSSTMSAPLIERAAGGGRTGGGGRNNDRRNR